MSLSLKSIELNGFKSFGKKSELVFGSQISSIVGPNGSGKSNVAEAFRFVLGEQSMKSMRSKKGEDLIWGGSPGLGRMSRASVKVVFDNSPDRAGKRLLDVDFGEVVIERVVYRDGQNEYLMNGTQVRLKDVIRLLAGANIGGSGYQIISQGEADRILNASPKERREMVEDALGLKLYQHKKAESERKLEETAHNIEKTRSLRREITPHLNFLRTQVEKLEKAREMKEELSAKLREYLVREHAWILEEDSRLITEAHMHEMEIKQRHGKLADARSKSRGGGDSRITELQVRLNSTERLLAEARKESEKLARELGRAEGAAATNNVTVEQIVAVPHVRGFARELEHALADAEKKHDIVEVRGVLMHLRERIRSFVEGLSGAAPVTNQEAKALVDELSSTLEAKRREEGVLAEDISTLRREISESREAGFAAERDIVELEGQIREAQSLQNAVQAARASIVALRARFDDEVREGVALVGMGIRDWDKTEVPINATAEDRHEQEKRHRVIERLKIKIEESGLGQGDEVIREFNQTKERDEFLTRELADLERSAASLKDIIAELEKTIDERFKEGLKHINVALTGFFQKLFSGGEASLKIEEPRRRRAGPSEEDDENIDDISEEEDLYAGLTVSVHLPRKKVHGLEVLSGGERALTSIALIFSMSQVNPPPFLILDETDAALDEANSKRYADMIEELGKKSQLIVITHNRETMRRAGILYGVTMGNDGISKLLSIKFEEAVAVAK